MSDDQGNPVLYGHEYAALKAMIETMLAAEKKATEKPWHAIRQGRNTPDGWREWMDVWGPDGEPLIGCDENPMEFRNVRNGDNDAEFIVIARNNFERIARMAIRFAERACAAESAFSDLAESGEGVPFGRVSTYLRSADGWDVMEAPSRECVQWFHRSEARKFSRGEPDRLAVWTADDNVTLYPDQAACSADITRIALREGRSVAEVMRDIFGVGQRG
jgi:hypothetical protein